MYLGIDLGTSAVKLCVMAPGGEIVDTATEPLSTQTQATGASEQEAETWWQAVVSAMARLPAEIRPQIRALGLSGQMHGAVLLDAERRPIRPVMLWNDARAAGECETLNTRAPDMGRRTGAPPMPGFTGPKILWIARNEPEIHARIAHILLPKDYIGLRLHGGCVTDPSDAAGTALLDGENRAWAADICALCAVDPAWLPEIRHGTEIAGHLQRDAAAALGLAPGLPIATGAGDAAAGAVGIGAVRAGDAFISLGTSGQLFVTTESYHPNPEARLHTYAHTIPGHWFQMAAMLNGARPMAWLADLLRRPIAALLAEAEDAPPGPLFLPYLTGERTPHGDTDIRGGFAGLGEALSQGTLMRAVVEGIAFTFADAVEVLGQSGPIPTEVMAIGGGARSDLLLQTIADVTGASVGRSAGAEIGPALGAARLAYLAESDRPASEILSKPEIRDWFRPRTGPEQDKLRQRLAGFRSLYPALREVQAQSRST